MEPWWNPPRALPQGRPGPPRSLSRLRPQSFQLLGKNKRSTHPRHVERSSTLRIRRVSPNSYDRCSGVWGSRIMDQPVPPSAHGPKMPERTSLLDLGQCLQNTHQQAFATYSFPSRCGVTRSSGVVCSSVPVGSAPSLAGQLVYARFCALVSESEASGGDLHSCSTQKVKQPSLLICNSIAPR